MTAAARAEARAAATEAAARAPAAVARAPVAAARRRPRGVRATVARIVADGCDEHGGRRRLRRGARGRPGDRRDDAACGRTSSDAQGPTAGEATWRPAPAAAPGRASAPRPCRTHLGAPRRARASSPGRSAGSFERARCSTSSTPSGSDGSSCSALGTSAFRWPNASVTGVSAANGLRPVRSSKATTPSA